MQSTLTPQETDPHDIFLIEPDVVLAARAKPASPDPVHDALSRLAHRAARTTPAVAAPAVAAGTSIPPVDTTFRAAAVDAIKVDTVENPRQARRDRSEIGKWAKSTSIAFLFALCSAIAAAAWKHDGGAIRQRIANWLPPFMLASSSPAAATPPAAPPAPAEQADPSPTAVTTSDQAPAQPAQPSESATPAPAASVAELTPSVLSMARDLATMGQQIEQLKASIEQLKAGQAQMSRDIAKASEAKASEQNQRARIAALRAARRPKPAFPPAPTAAVSSLPPPPSAAPFVPSRPALSPPAPPSQAAIEPDGEPVVRPPMPLR